MKKNKPLAAVAALVFGLMVSRGTAESACSIDIPDVVATGNAVLASGQLAVGLLSINVTCPAGQSWTLSAEFVGGPPNIYYGGPRLYVCRPGQQLGAACNTYYLYSGTVLASGAGTGSPQQAVQLATNLTGVSSLAYFQNRYVYAVTSLGPGASGAMFKLVGDTTVTKNFTASAIINQTCEITSTTNMAINYTGAARADGSFGVNYVCGTGSPVPMVMRVGAGNNASGEVRRAAKSGGYIGYRLYWDSARSQEIGITSNNSLTLPTTPSYGAQTVYGSVLKVDPGNINPAGNGIYTDTVTVSIDY